MFYTNLFTIYKERSTLSKQILDTDSPINTK